MDDLRSDRVVVAGGSSGIGFAAARLLVERGARVVVTGRNLERLESARDALGPNAAAASFDAGDPAERARALETIGRFDHLVLALSGGKGAGPFGDVAPAALRTGFDGKFWPHYGLVQDALGHLRDDGSITFVSAISAHAAMPGTAGLAAVNAAIEGLVRPLAVELRPRRVNAVAPGVIDTPWWSRLPEAERRATFEAFAAVTPVGRVGRPEDVAGAIVFLIANSFMTGCVLDCDGGLRLVGRELGPVRPRSRTPADRGRLE